MSSQRHDPEPQRASGQEYLEIELDLATMREVEILAAEASVSPFNLCVDLLREEMAARNGLILQR